MRLIIIQNQMKKIFGFIFFSIFFFAIIGCRKDEINLSKNPEGYDIILVMGQSNTHYGFGIDPVLDATHPLIQQLGRFDTNNYKIIPAKEPLDHHTKKNNRIGFALTFAKFYANEYLEDGRQILIIPCGKSGSGFHNNKWNKGDPFYNDAVARTLFVLTNYPNSKLSVILWHQGEDDVNNMGFQEKLDDFIFEIRNDLDAQNIPFILGGMVPVWANKSLCRAQAQFIIQDTPNRIENTGYADPALPFLIEADTVEENEIHFTAEGLREMGARYFLEFGEMR